jgi:hypothetical protein
MKRFVTSLALLSAVLTLGTAHSAPIYYADGDLALLGAPNNIVDISDFLIANHIASGEVPTTQ